MPKFKPSRVFIIYISCLILVIISAFMIGFSLVNSRKKVPIVIQDGEGTLLADKSGADSKSVDSINLPTGNIGNVITPIAKPLQSNEQKSKILVLPVLMYHHINNLDGVALTNKVEIGLRVNPDVFEKQIEYILGKGYNSITADQLSSYIQGKSSLPPKPVLFTFDDGYKDAITYALPILKKHNAIGDFAIITGTIGTGGYMSWDDVRTLKKEGMGISSHTINHCYLAINKDPKTATIGPFADSPVNDTPNQRCPHLDFGGQLNTGQVRGELKESKEKLESELGTNIYSIVYPYGKYNQQGVAIAKSLGYTIGFTVALQSKNNLDISKPFELSRLRMNGQQTGDIEVLKRFI